MPRQKLTLKQWRARAGLTQVELSFKSGVSLSTVTGAESGRHLPSIENALKIVTALSIGLDDVAWIAQNDDEDNKYKIDS